ncbi:MAG: outer membrane protein assembly factor BamD [Simkaniaceae bacterium]|nr:outer membrane protein assembly factor BamD [Simkaniaceae bacterium]
MKKFTLIFLICFGALSANPLDPVVRSQINVHQYYSKMIDHYESEDWQNLAWRCQDLIADFSTSPFAREAYYYLGVAYFKLGELENSNHAFSDYLKVELSPKFFDQVMRYKFEIAKAFDEGAKVHLFGWNKMPKWIPAYDEALAIYDEVITTLPRDDLSAQSLYRKGAILLRIDEYKKSIDAFQTLIRRFPKHPLSVEAYIGICEVYLSECDKDFPDTNKLELAEINLRNFRNHFPGEPRIAEAEKKLMGMKDHLAQDLLEIAEFYERTKKKKAAAIYYATILKKYPDTKAATKSEKRLKVLDVPDVYSKKKTKESPLIVDSAN